MDHLKKRTNHIVEIYKFGDYKKAEVLTKEIIEENANNAFFHNLLGLILVQQDKIDEAIASYEKGIKIDPKFAMIYNNLGLLYANNKQDDKKAIYFYEKSLILASMLVTF